MLDVLYFFPRWLISCKNSLEIEKVDEEMWKTYCPSSHECYGCDGSIRFGHPRNPTGYKQIYQFDIYGVSDPKLYTMPEEYVTEKVQMFIDSEEQYYMIRGIRADVDCVMIYEWEDPENEI